MWDAVYPDIAADIQPKQLIFIQVCITITSQCMSDISMFQSIQRITEWHGMFGSGAIAAVENIWLNKDIHTLEGRKKYARHMLSRGLPFTWHAFNSSLREGMSSRCLASVSPDYGWVQKGSGLFQSEPILSTLALHFTITSSLGDEVRSTNFPRGALLLAVVVVSHLPLACGNFLTSFWIAWMCPDTVCGDRWSRTTCLKME